MSKIVFSTGAGISVPSGILPYRGTNGIYTLNPNLENDLSANKYQNPQTRHLVLAAIAKMKKSIDFALPNAAHFAIAKLQEHHEVTVITQNVDNLHRIAGSTDIIELHGNLFAERLDDEGNLRPDVILFGESLSEEVCQQAGSSIQNADVIIAVGTSATVYPAAYLMLEADDRAFEYCIPFYYLSIDLPEMNLANMQFIQGSAEITVPELCDKLVI